MYTLCISKFYVTYTSIKLKRDKRREGKREKGREGEGRRKERKERRKEGTGQEVSSGKPTPLSEKEAFYALVLIP